jgi:hypothetical protein
MWWLIVVVDIIVFHLRGMPAAYMTTPFGQYGSVYNDVKTNAPRRCREDTIAS